MRLNSKGQVTVPAELRRQFGRREGDEADVADSCVLLDVATADPQWAEWSGKALERALVGAHAAVRSYRLLTRDTTRYRTYFPRLRLIAPD
ncbi:AbrB/MazE/SpoVT family DNA-binding domain-containing protein [Jiangella endophytica]|uniref:AbrB/MazE/SpoVT family DNA-binding domain-containing protein n=1 Tax=Jiangella endophytica TaxID=1623398 RepID=UPI000E3475F3|nr:AbrB/MazE/SpoVT family DNA-binding domain-containing protein [Jiangella endophytica]